MTPEEAVEKGRRSNDRWIAERAASTQPVVVPLDGDRGDPAPGGHGDNRGTRPGPRSKRSRPRKMSSGDTGTGVRRGWTAAELLSTTIPSARWAVAGFLPEGMVVLAGAPKLGKSWLCLNLALDIAAGRPVLDTYPSTAGDVLYLALEDNPRRLQFRTRTCLDAETPDDLIGDDRTGLDRLTLYPVGSVGGWTEAQSVITEWVTTHPGRRLVIVDVWTRIRPPSASTLPQYQTDYEAGVKLKALADELRVCILAVHHTREAQADDFLDSVSGSRGFTGAADAVLVLDRKRGEGSATLHSTGRDIADATLTVAFDKEKGRWSSSEPMFPPGTKATVHDYVRRHPGTTPKWIADGTGLPHETVKKTCRRLADDGHLVSESGAYRASGATPVPVSPDDELPGQTAISLGTRLVPEAAPVSPNHWRDPG